MEIMEVVVTVMTMAMVITCDGYRPCFVQLAMGGRNDGSTVLAQGGPQERKTSSWTATVPTMILLQCKNVLFSKISGWAVTHPLDPPLGGRVQLKNRSL
jgi:hypothetical protein